MIISDPENIDVNNESSRYEIHIDNFNGPLDLLWELIKKSKIDITEVSISHITEQYIGFLKLMEELNVKIAIEFIWMASELLYYKSKALLPSEEIEDEFFVPPLPRELIDKLIEYKKFQQTSQKLSNLFESQNNMFVRECDAKEIIGQEEYIEVSLFDLLKAFSQVIESEGVIEKKEIIFDELLVSDKIEYITNKLKENEIILFHEIFTRRPTRPEIVVTFLAILELTKIGMIKVVQHKVFGDIRIARKFTLEEVS